jgi:protein SCO1/2
MKELRAPAILLTILLAAARPAGAEVSAGGAGYARPIAAESVAIDEHLGGTIDKSLELTREDGARVRLGDYFSDGRPVLLVLAYYRCPMLCGLVLRGVVEGLKDLDFELGQHYRALTVSIDPRDQSEAAEQKQASTLAGLGHPDRTAAWPFFKCASPAQPSVAASYTARASGVAARRCRFR